MLGPSFGLAFLGALKRLWKAKQTKRLVPGCNLLVLGADSYVLYPDVIVGEITHGEFSSDQPMKDIMSFVREAASECLAPADG
jgi:hypothetical protein